MEAKCWNVRNDTVYGRFYDFNTNNLWAFPADQRTFQLIEVQNEAALKIQSLWRGYRVRQICKTAHVVMAKEKAAVVIQRKVRQWLQYKKKKTKHKQHELLDGLSDEELAKLQQEIKHLQEDQGHVKFQGFQHLEQSHSEMQSCLSSWYARSNTRHRRQQQMEAQCTQLEATSILLQGSPALSDSGEVDLSFYECLALSHATRARLDHKQRLRILNAPWWKRLELQHDWT